MQQLLILPGRVRIQEERQIISKRCQVHLLCLALLYVFHSTLLVIAFLFIENRVVIRHILQNLVFTSLGRQALFTEVYFLDPLTTLTWFSQSYWGHCPGCGHNHMLAATCSHKCELSAWWSPTVIQLSKIGHTMSATRDITPIWHPHNPILAHMFKLCGCLVRLESKQFSWSVGHSDSEFSPTVVHS